MKASDAIAQLLAYKKINYGFELIGGMIAHLVDSINLLGKTKLISVHHEQAAAFAAGGVARATNNTVLGVALGTSGPGATNLVTGIADCWLDNVPCLFITGQVNTHESKGERQIKQQGFQELDSVKIVESITKYAVKIDSVETLLPEINKAIDIACSGRPGPVLIDIPMNIQREEIDESQLMALMTPISAIEPNQTLCDAQNNQTEINQVVTIYKKLLAASKPLVLLGGGALNNDLLHPFISILKELHIPYTASLKGCEKIPDDDAYLGMMGSYGTRVANYAVQTCDVLLVIGSRLDVRQTGSDCQDFARNAFVIQVDIDEHQLNNRIKGDVSLQMDSRSFYEMFVNQLPSVDRNNFWLTELMNKKNAHYKNEYTELKLGPFDVFDIINQTFRDVAVQFVCDVGNNQMWAAHTIQLSQHQKMHHSGGLGAMGFAIPTSLGVHMGSQLPVVSFSGDGGTQLNIQELDIIAREKLPILTIVLNNKALGMVKNFQEMYFDGRDESTHWRNYSCDFVGIAHGYNMEAHRARNVGEIGNILDGFVSNPRAILLEIDMESVNECRPRLSFGDKLDEQSPKCVNDM